MALRLSAAYDWKMEDGVMSLDGNGNPIWIGEGGAEMSVQHDTIARLSREAKGHRERAEAAEAAAKRFEGIADPAAALKALETVGKLDAKQLIDAGQVDQVKAEITKQYEQRLADQQKALDEATNGMKQMRLENAFKGSDFIRDNIAVPLDFFQAAFKERFKDENGTLVAYGPDGNPVYSKKSVGELASFDEALSLMVENHPQKELILKAPDARGSGNQGEGGQRKPGGNFISKADYEAAAPSEKAAIGQKLASGELTMR